MENPINKIQRQPYDVRVRILWGVVAVVAVVLIYLIITSVKNTIQNAGGNFTKIEAARFVPESSIAFGSVERVEITDKTLKVYFNINNPDNDVLNIPKLSNVSLNIGKGLTHPQKITDRQGNPFVQKVLSHTKNFGIMTFEPVDGSKGTLVLDKMFLEQSPSDVFQQKIWLDLNKLNSSASVRN